MPIHKKENYTGMTSQSIQDIYKMNMDYSVHGDYFIETDFRRKNSNKRIWAYAEHIYAPRIAEYLQKDDGVEELNQIIRLSMRFSGEDVERLSRLIQEALVKYDTTVPMDIVAFSDDIRHKYVKETAASDATPREKVSQTKDVREWISFMLEIISIILAIYSVINTREADTSQSVTQVNNYYTIEQQIDAAYLNEMDYRIINRNEVMPREKPDCNSKVTGHLKLGQLVMVEGHYRKWVQISWTDAQEHMCPGWVQNYKMTKFE